MILTMLASDLFNRHTLEPAALSRCEPTHLSPSARPFRLPFNGLARAELRRIFCSDEFGQAPNDAAANSTHLSPSIPTPVQRVSPS